MAPGPLILPRRLQRSHQKEEQTLTVDYTVTDGSDATGWLLCHHPHYTTTLRHLLCLNKQ